MHKRTEGLRTSPQAASKTTLHRTCVFNFSSGMRRFSFGRGMGKGKETWARETSRERESIRISIYIVILYARAIDQTHTDVEIMIQPPPPPPPIDFGTNVRGGGGRWTGGDWRTAPPCCWAHLGSNPCPKTSSPPFSLSLSLSSSLPQQKWLLRLLSSTPKSSRTPILPSALNFRYLPHLGDKKDSQTMVLIGKKRHILLKDSQAKVRYLRSSGADLARGSSKPASAEKVLRDTATG